MRFYQKIFLGLGVLLLAGVIFWFFGERGQIVRAGEADNVSGFAWSETTGWISFNSINCDTNGNGKSEGHGGCPGGQDMGNYGVNLNHLTRGFSGYAWSEHIGWISFNESDLVGCPSGVCKAILDLGGSRKIIGWARALSPIGNSQAGGWEGWIKLSGVANDGSPFGVFWNPITMEFEGYAWGSDVVGWISFNCKNNNNCANSNYQVKANINFVPALTGLTVNGGDYCNAPLRPIYSWTFSDPDSGDTQSAYRVQVATSSSFTGLLVDDSGVVSGSVSSYTSLNALPYYNTAYYWRAKVWDSYGGESNWVEGPYFLTPDHAYPWPKFTWFPALPSRDEYIQFDSSQSECYNIVGELIPCSGSSFLWTFPGDTVFATGSSPTSENPQAKFISTGSKTVTLNIQDAVGSCTTSRSFNVIILPKWKEISP